MAFLSRIRLSPIELGLLALAPQIAWPQNACDLNGDAVVNVVDVQLASNMANNLTPCTANIKGAGVCDREVWDRVLAAALGGPCVVTTGPVPHSVTLNWTASTSPNLKGYNVYRSASSGGPYTKVNSAIILGGSTTTYTDTTVLGGQTYYYVATAVDSSDNESAYSNEAQAVMPTP